MDRKLRIAFITNNYFPYSGGVVHSIEAFTQELRKQGHQVWIITLDFLGNSTCDHEYVIRIHCPIRFQYKKNHMAIPWRPDAQIHDILNRLHPDIIHVHHPFLLGNAALKFANKYTIPTVFTYHTLYEKFTHYIPLPKTVIQPVTKKVVKIFCNKVQGIIAPSSYIQQYVLNNEISVPVKIIPSPINQSYLDKYKKKEYAERFRLLTVSRFTKEKKITRLLDVFSQLDSRKFEFTVVGYGYELDNLKQYAYKKLGLSPSSVTFIVKPSQSKLKDMYQNADLFIYGCPTEIQGLVLAEAMACANPVVSFAGPGQKDIIKNGYNGYIVDSITEMKQAIEMIASNNALSEALATGALNTAQKYAPTRLTNQLTIFYYQMILN